MTLSIDTLRLFEAAQKSPFSPVAKQLNNLRRHELYYLVGGDLHLLVSFPLCWMEMDIHDVPQAENTLFRVHSWFFTRESPIFESYCTPDPSGKRMGSEDATAFILDGVKPEEFVKFLTIFYNP